MPRNRKDNTAGLPERVYLKHGAFYYVHPSGKWERIGTSIEEAHLVGRLYAASDNHFGTVAYWLDMFLLHCKDRTTLPSKKGGLAEQTYKDYVKTAEMLKTYFGQMYAHQVKSYHVAEYLDLGVKNNRAVRANREKATLSACYSWLMRLEESGITANPCIGVRRNKETKRARYVTDEEYKVVHDIAHPNVAALLDLIYLTLQRPEDIVSWSDKNIIQKTNIDGTTTTVLRNVQAKKNGEKIVDILITPEIQNILNSLQSRHGLTFIRTNRGTPYTYSGLTTMLARAIEQAGVKRFGFYDMKGKGATDMWRRGVPLEQIQILCGHESVTTTEKYVKARWIDTVTPNTKHPQNIV